MSSQCRLHDTILAIGSVPLPVIEQHTAQFIAAALASETRQERQEPSRLGARLMWVALVLTVDTTAYSVD